MPIEIRTYRVLNTGVCPLPDTGNPDPPAPDWQFVGPVQCEELDVNFRTNANRIARKRNMNPDSSTYLMWASGEGPNYAAQLSESLAEWYFYDSDASACPVPQQPDVAGVSMYKAQYATIEQQAGYDEQGNPIYIQQTVVRAWVFRQTGTKQVSLQLGVYSGPTVGQLVPNTEVSLILPANTVYARVSFTTLIENIGSHYIGIKQVNTENVDILGNQFQAISLAPNNTLENIPI